MEGFKQFLASNYIWFIVASGVLLISLIGCLIDLKKKKKEIEKTEVLETLSLDTKVEQLDVAPAAGQSEPVEQLDTPSN